MPWEQLSDIVWYNRDDWDATAWQMVGRPERSDPDEIIFNLFHSTTAANGYNFIGYQNPDYDALVEKQRVTIGPGCAPGHRVPGAGDARRRPAEHDAGPPPAELRVRQHVWDASTVVDQAGIGIKNFWTFVGLAPLGEQKDIIVNSGDNVISVNPLYVSGSTDSWVTELVWDRLFRVGPDGLPQELGRHGYEWRDDTTLAVTIRTDMTWHDGEPVTAEDVKFSFEATQGGEAPMYAPFSSNITSVEVEGEDTVVFHPEPAVGRRSSPPASPRST